MVDGVDLFPKVTVSLQKMSSIITRRGQAAVRQSRPIAEDDVAAR